MSTGEKILSKSEKIKWIFSVALPLTLFSIPTNDILTWDLRNFLIVTLFGIMLFGFELINTLMSSLVLVFGYLILKIAPIGVVMAPWSQDMPWMMLGSFILVNIVQRTNILNRVSYFCILKTGSTYMGIILGMITIGIVIATIIPTASAVVGLCVIACGLCKSLNLGVNKTSAGIMIATMIGFMDAYYFIYSPTYISMLYSAVNQLVPVEPNYITFFRDNAIFVIGIYLKGIIIGFLTKPKEPISGRKYFSEQQQLLGKMTKDEKKIIVVLLAFVIYLFTYQWHGQSMLYGFIIAPLILYLPGFNVGTMEDVKNADYPVVVFIAACMSIGSVAVYIGAGDAFSTLIYPLLENTTKVTFLALIWIIIVILNFLMTPAAEMAAFGVPFAQMCLDLNIGVYPMMYTFFQGCCNLLMPYEAGMWLIAYGFGVMKLKHFIKYMGVKMIFDFAFLLIAGVPYWIFLGIL